MKYKIKKRSKALDFAVVSSLQFSMSEEQLPGQIEVLKGKTFVVFGVLVTLEQNELAQEINQRQWQQGFLSIPFSS